MIGNGIRMEAGHSLVDERSATAVELLPFFIEKGTIYRISPRGAPSLRVELPSGVHPHDLAQDAIAEMGSASIAVHSTSWRSEDGRLVITYLAVVPNFPEATEDYLAVAVDGHQLARGTATEPPAAIHVEEVAAHALRHLAWLARDDEAVREALGEDWLQALDGFHPHPFFAYHAPEYVPEERKTVPWRRLIQGPTSSLRGWFARVAPACPLCWPVAIQ